ncbi:MAG TPA: hypothetical protein VFH72_11310 [Candidatus Baltobacteraceae bacterium]|nr:hypothetical protein [Candidatus Baltobacteraceae bacterium]
MKHISRWLLITVASLLIILARPCESVASPHGGPVVRNVQLSIQGPANVRLGEPIFVSVSVTPTSGHGEFVEYGSISMVNFQVSDANSNVLQSLHPLGQTILLHSYLAVKDMKTFDLRRYAAIDHPGTYTVIAHLPAIFYGSRHVILEKTALTSNTITITVTP